MDLASIIAGAVTRAGIDMLRERIEGSDDPEEAWKIGVQQCITQAQISMEQYYRETRSPDFGRLEQDIGNIGTSARELSVYGQRRGYDEELTQWIGTFATACADYANAPTVNDYRYEDEFESSLAEMGSKIRDKTDSEE